MSRRRSLAPMSALRRDLQPGSYTPLVTPFHKGTIDWDAFEQSVLRQVSAGSQGVVVSGTTGEPTSLTAAERTESFRRAVAVADGRIAVVAGVGAPDQATTFDLAEAAVQAGVAALLVVTPAFVKPSQRALVQHFTAVAARTSLPVLLYNIPGRAGTAIEPETVARVVDAAPNVVGIKHASADLDVLTILFATLGSDFHVFCGAESLSYPMLALGASGLMSAVGNLFPQEVAELCRSVAADDHPRALEIHRHLFDVNRAVFFDTNPVPLKAMLKSHGLGSDEVRPPLATLDLATRDRVLGVIERYQPEMLDPTGAR